jgi:hypothetical protein
MKKSNKTRMCRVGIFLIGLTCVGCPGIWEETEYRELPMSCESDTDCLEYGEEWYCDTGKNHCEPTSDSDDTDTDTVSQ